METHRCGGLLQPVQVKIKKKIGFSYQTFTVDGFKCDCCGEEIISRDTAFEIDRTIVQLKQLWSHWRIPGDTKVTPLDKQEPKDTNLIDNLFMSASNTRIIYNH